MSEKKKELLRTLKFTLFSISAGVIQIGSFTLLNEFVIRDSDLAWICHLISLILSVIWNFTLNRKYTFQSASNVSKAMALVALFYLVFTPLSTWWTKALTQQAHWNEYLVEAGTMLINFVTEYLYQRFVVFRGSIDTAVKP